MRESLAEAKSRRDPKSDRTSLSVADAPADPEIETIDQIWNYAVQPSEWTPTASLVFLAPSALTWFSSLVIAFLFYLAFVTVFSLFMIYRVMPTHGKKNPVVYLSVCSVVGSISVMAIKVRAGRATVSKPLRGLAGLIHTSLSQGLGVAIKLTFAGDNQFTHPTTYLFGAAVAGSIMVQCDMSLALLNLGLWLNRSAARCTTG